MKETWDKYSKIFSEYCALADEFDNGISEPRIKKAYKKLTDKLNHVIHLHNEYDDVVQPLQSVEVKMPFIGEDFQETWTIYKEYLIENFQRYLGSRQEGVF